MLTDLPMIAKERNMVVNVWTGDKQFVDVMKFHPCATFTSIDCGVINPFLVDILRLRELYDLGNGHQLQQFRRAWGFPVDPKPMGAMVNSQVRSSNRVILHFEASTKNVTWQRQYWHPRMRMLYPENKAILESFIRSRSDLEFIEVGKASSDIAGSVYVPTATVEDLIKLVQSGSWFIGIMSGPLHVAVASSLKCIVVCNYPEAPRIVLPCLKYTGTPEEEWYYPQNVHLHQEGSSPLVPKFTKNSLQAAFSGDVYPFWQDDWLGLINEV
jgi:hypothetical protein